MMRRLIDWMSLVLVLMLGISAEAKESDVIRIGIIGLDTSHSPAFVKEFNADHNEDDPLAGFRVVAAYPYGSSQIESSASRIPAYTEQVKGMGVAIVDSIDALLEQVDCVLLETNDGTLHHEQALAVFRAGKPVFIDKPVGSNLAEVLAIYDAAEHFQVPMFSSSSLRYSNGAQSIREGAVGAVLGCSAHSPCKLEPSHVDLYWYGIHGVEILYTCMGTGCEAVSHVSTDEFELAVGRWGDGRIGTFRGIRAGSSGYGGLVYGEKAIREIGKYDGYRPLLVEIAEFFRTKTSPIQRDETIELYAFMQAAWASKRNGGQPVTIDSVMEEAQGRAREMNASLYR